MVRFYTIKECARRLHLRQGDERIVNSLRSKNKLNWRKDKNRIRISEDDVVHMLDEMRREETYDEIILKLRDLMMLFKKNKLQIPFFLKGMAGECLTMKKLLSQQHLKNSVILYLGGTTPKEDIVVDGGKLQVKTHFSDARIKNVKCFSSPTISRRTFDFVDYIVLVVVQDNDLLTSKFYVFNKDEFRYFSKVGCWSGKSKGDKTIFYIQKINGELTRSAKKIVEKYDTPDYRKLFANSKNKWEKIVCVTDTAN